MLFCFMFCGSLLPDVGEAAEPSLKKQDSIDTEAKKKDVMKKNVEQRGVIQQEKDNNFTLKLPFDSAPIALYYAHADWTCDHLLRQTL